MNFDGDINENHNCARKKFKELEINNAFIRKEPFWDKENELLDKFKVRTML